MDTVEVPLTKGKVAIIDARDASLVLPHKWHADESHGNFYAKRDLPGGKKVRLHRLIYQHYHGPAPQGHVIDHINRNSLDNRLENLRAVSHSINKANSVGKRNRKHNLPKGVNPNSNGYMTRIKFQGQKIYLGTYRTPDDASEVYKMAWQVFYGA